MTPLIERWNCIIDIHNGMVWVEIRVSSIPLPFRLEACHVNPHGLHLDGCFERCRILTD